MEQRDFTLAFGDLTRLQRRSCIPTSSESMRRYTTVWCQYVFDPTKDKENSAL